MTTETKPEALTKTVAGHAITLTPGRRYIVGRDIGTRGRTEFTVEVKDITDGLSVFSKTVWEVTGLSYKAANALLAEFNNGPRCVPLNTFRATPSRRSRAWPRTSASTRRPRATRPSSSG
jgi:hypothetical protein